MEKHFYLRGYFDSEDSNFTPLYHEQAETLIGSLSKKLDSEVGKIKTRLHVGNLMHVFNDSLNISREFILQVYETLTQKGMGEPYVLIMIDAIQLYKKGSIPLVTDEIEYAINAYCNTFESPFIRLLELSTNPALFDADNAQATFTNTYNALKNKDLADLNEEGFNVEEPTRLTEEQLLATLDESDDSGENSFIIDGDSITKNKDANYDGVSTEELDFLIGRKNLNTSSSDGSKIDLLLDEDTYNANPMLSEALGSINNSDDESLHSATNTLDFALIDLEEDVGNIRESALDGIDFDSEISRLDNENSELIDDLDEDSYDSREGLLNEIDFDGVIANLDEENEQLVHTVEEDLELVDDYEEDTLESSLDEVDYDSVIAKLDEENSQLDTDYDDSKITLHLEDEDYSEEEINIEEITESINESEVNLEGGESDIVESEDGELDDISNFLEEVSIEDYKSEEEEQMAVDTPVININPLVEDDVVEMTSPITREVKPKELFDSNAQVIVVDSRDVSVSEIKNKLEEQKPKTNEVKLDPIVVIPRDNVELKPIQPAPEDDGEREEQEGDNNHEQEGIIGGESNIEPVDEVNDKESPLIKEQDNNEEIKEISLTDPALGLVKDVKSSESTESLTDEEIVGLKRYEGNSVDIESIVNEALIKATEKFSEQLQQVTEHYESKITAISKELEERNRLLSVIESTKLPYPHLQPTNEEQRNKHLIRDVAKVEGNKIFGMEDVLAPEPTVVFYEEEKKPVLDSDIGYIYKSDLGDRSSSLREANRLKQFDAERKRIVANILRSKGVDKNE